MLQKLLPTRISSLALLLTSPLLAASNQLLHPSSLQSSEVGLPQQVVKDQPGWRQHPEAHAGRQSLRSPNSRVHQDEATMAEALHSMQTALSRILANQEWLMRNQQYLMKREKYLLSQQKLVTPYVGKAKGLQEPQKPDNAGSHWGEGKLMEKMRRESVLEKEKVRWENEMVRWEESLENENLGLPDHLQPSRIIISNFRREAAGTKGGFVRFPSTFDGEDEGG